VFRPAYLELHEVTDDSYDLTWRLPLVNGRPAQLELVYPEGTELLGEVRRLQLPNGLVEQLRIQRHEGLIGQRLGLRGGATGDSAY